MLLCLLPFISVLLLHLLVYLHFFSPLSYSVFPTPFLCLCFLVFFSLQDLMWKYGIDADVLDDNIRTMEVRNWVKNQVIPRLI